MKKDADDANVTATKTEKFFQDRQARADFETFDRNLHRPTGEPPVAGDELPE